MRLRPRCDQGHRVCLCARSALGNSVCRKKEHEICLDHNDQIKVWFFKNKNRLRICFRYVLDQLRVCLAGGVIVVAFSSYDNLCLITIRFK
jgi:hypothetical protein